MCHIAFVKPLLWYYTMVTSKHPRKTVLTFTPTVTSPMLWKHTERFGQTHTEQWELACKDK